MENDIICPFCGKKIQTPDVVKNKIIDTYMETFMERWDIELEKDIEQFHAKLLRMNKKHNFGDDFVEQMMALIHR